VTVSLSSAEAAYGSLRKLAAEVAHLNRPLDELTISSIASTKCDIQALDMAYYTYSCSCRTSTNICVNYTSDEQCSSS